MCAWSTSAKGLVERAKARMGSKIVKGAIRMFKGSSKDYGHCERAIERKGEARRE